MVVWDGSHTDFVTLVGLAWPFGFVPYHRSEGASRLQKALDIRAGHHRLVQIRVLTGAGCIRLMRGHEPASRAFNEEALALSHEVGELHPVDSPLNGLAICASVRGDFDESQRLALQALAMPRANIDKVPQALPMASVILCNIGWNLFSQGHVDEAERLVDEALELQHDLGFD